MLNGVAPRTRDLTKPALIAQAVSARREYLSLTQEDLGVGRSTVSLLEGGDRDRYQSAKLATVGRRLGWPVDWIDRVEAGEDLTLYRAEPIEATTPPGEARTAWTDERLDGLDAEIRALRQWREEAMAWGPVREAEIAALEQRVASLEASQRLAG